MSLSEKEQQKLAVVKQTLGQEITNEQASKILGLSVRQIKRLKQKVKISGTEGIVHGLKNKRSNHECESKIKQKALSLIEKHYRDFKPGFATEKLQELHKIEITSQTVRVWMSEAGLWKSKKQKRIDYHAWRPRKDYYGELEQFDGCYHYWFEDRFVDEQENRIEVCLLAAIDDATGRVTEATFTANEGVIAVFLFWQSYLQTKGKPLKIYLDKFSTYKINHQAAVDNSELMTQFQRAMHDLGIELIPAHSPQAKGRIERLFSTLQDRLVKELRLAGISTPEAGNKFLKETFIPKFNSKFAVKAAKDGDVHQPLNDSDRKNKSRIFAIQSHRTVNNDFTIQFKGRWYQLLEIQTVTVRARDQILVEEWLDGTIHFSLRQQYLGFTLLPDRPEKFKSNPLILTTHKLHWKPPANHPWKKSFKTQF